jgi:hypothetical protein
MHIYIPMIFGDFQKQGVFQQNPNYGLTPLMAKELQKSL